MAGGYSINQKTDGSLEVEDNTNNVVAFGCDANGGFYAPKSSLVTITATGSITPAANAGRTNLLGEVGGDALVTLTLPAATGTGHIYHFEVSVVNTSNYVIKVADGTDTIDGLVIGAADAGNTVNGWETAATSDTITLNGTTTGGAAIGDWIELRDIGTNQWTVKGQITQTGTEATPFSATVT